MPPPRPPDGRHTTPRPAGDVLQRGFRHPQRRTGPRRVRPGSERCAGRQTDIRLAARSPRPGPGAGRHLPSRPPAPTRIEPRRPGDSRPRAGCVWSIRRCSGKPTRRSCWRRCAAGAGRSARSSSKTRRFTDEARLLTQIDELARQLSVGVENVQLLEQVLRQRQQLAQSEKLASLGRVRGRHRARDEQPAAGRTGPSRAVDADVRRRTADPETAARHLPGSGSRRENRA